MTDFDPNDWQGRRQDQVENNERIGAVSFIIFVVLMTAVIISKNF